MEQPKAEHKHITLGVICAWVFGVLFAVSVISSLAEGNIIASLISLMMAVILIPPVWEKVRAKTKINLSPGVKILIVIIGLVITGITMNTDSSNSSSPDTTSESGVDDQAQQADTSEPLLELLNYSGSKSYGYITVEGEVKNISGEKMESVVAVVRAYDANGDFVTSGDAIIDYNPILADQTSPFSVMIQDNPAIDKYLVEFKEFWGGTIETKRSTN